MLKPNVVRLRAKIDGEQLPGNDAPARTFAPASTHISATAPTVELGRLREITDEIVSGIRNCFPARIFTAEQERLFAKPTQEDDLPSLVNKMLAAVVFYRDVAKRLDFSGAGAFTQSEIDRFDEGLSLVKDFVVKAGCQLGGAAINESQKLELLLSSLRQGAHYISRGAQEIADAVKRIGVESFRPRPTAKEFIALAPEEMTRLCTFDLQDTVQELTMNFSLPVSDRQLLAERFQSIVSRIPDEATRKDFARDVIPTLALEQSAADLLTRTVARMFCEKVPESSMRKLPVEDQVAIRVRNLHGAIEEAKDLNPNLGAVERRQIANRLNYELVALPAEARTLFINRIVQHHDLRIIREIQIASERLMTSYPMYGKELQEALRLARTTGP